VFNNPTIAYIYVGAGPGYGSVYDKIIAQINGLNKQRVATQGVFLGFDFSLEQRKQQYVEYVKVEKITGRFFIKTRKRQKLIQALKKWADNNAGKYDKLYIRNYRPGFFWWLFLLKYGHKSITEHQTMEYLEVKALAKENPFGLKPSKLFSWLEHTLLPMINEKIFGSLALGATAQIVAVTREIGEYEVKRAFPPKPALTVIANGIDVEAYPLRTSPIFDGKQLKIMMLVGGSTAIDWHGIDLVMQGIEQYRGPIQIQLWLLGDVSVLKPYEAPYIVKPGFADKKMLNELSDTIHIGLGSFALQRKGLTEACSLKMREYAARGIPSVYGQEDADYEYLIKEGLALKLSPMVPPDMQKIIAFANKVYCDSGTAEKIRSTANAVMDMHLKIKELSEVFRRMIVAD
jgi:glycosyltransferase involved in cell wall biosynthesis